MKQPHVLWLCLVCVAISWGCTLLPKKSKTRDISGDYEEGTILSGKTGNPISYETMISELEDVQIVYVGEKHNLPEHHKIQLRIMETLYSDNPDLKVGMEMFDHTYQRVLNEWSAGKLDEETFLKKVHWYANWKYDFKLYRKILLFIKKNNLCLVGLNIPFHLSPKIAIGGIETLSAIEKQYLPKAIDTSDADHRAYVKKVFDHHHVKGRDDFENFYLAQCVWDEGMAETIADNIGGSKMVILAGNGHIYRKFGIPARTFRRNALPYRTIYLAPVGTGADPSDGDYVWVTAAAKRNRRHP
jgi:uncharacterized iron-regulated protein